MPFTRGQALASFLAAAGLDIVMGLHNLGAVVGGALTNPDSYMRIMRLEESLRGGMLAHVIPRDGSGMGTELRWTHLLDAILLLLAAPFAPFLPMRDALHAGGVLLGPLSTGLLGLALAWSCAPFSDARNRWFAAVMAGVAVPIAGYGAPGVVHHHIPVALAIVVATGWAMRGPAQGARAGVPMGLAAACAIVLTPEAMPFILMAVGGLGIAWARTPADGRAGAALGTFGATLLAVLLAAFAIDPPLAGYASAEIDRLSVVWVGFGLACAAIGSAVAWCDRRLPRPLSLTWAGVAVAVLGIGGWLAVFPAVAKGPAGLMPPDMAHAFFSGIAEMKPIGSVTDGVIFLAPGVLALGAMLVLAWRRASVIGLYAALCTATTLVLALLHIRFSTYPNLIGAAMLPVALTLAGERGVVRVALLASFLLLPPAAGALDGYLDTEVPSPPCPVTAAVPLLAPYAGEVVMANPNDTPELLYRTGVKTVGSLYHGNAAAFIRLRAAWRSPAEAVMPEAIRATKATLILICPSTQRSGLIGDLPANTLLDALNAGAPPPWLHRVGESPSSGLVLYRITP